MRVDGREKTELRHIHIHTNYLKHPEGSVLIEVGDTKVICSQLKSVYHRLCVEKEKDG